MAGTVEQKLTEQGITLPEPRAAMANYVGFVRTGNLLFVSGQVCANAEGKLAAKGKLGAGVTVEQGYAAAQVCAVNLLTQIKAALGDLDKVVRVVRLGGFVNSAPDFLDGPKVLNGASDLMVAAFGDKGRHARTTVGVASLPSDAAVEVDGVFEVSYIMRAPAWLTARPVAHRGLHDISRGIVENMPGAIEAAIAGNFAIEVDIQLTSDGEAMVHHDDALGRLTEGSGALLEKTAAELKAVKFKNTPERMMSLGDLCTLVAGRVPLVIEVKSHFDGDRKLVTRMAEVLASYSGPAVGMSFDPDQVLALRQLAPDLPRGIIAQRDYDDDYWKKLTKEQRDGMLYLRHGFRTKPHFVAFWVNQLPAPAPWIARNMFGCPLLTWTVRTPEQRDRAARYADQMIFEGFMP